MKQVKQRTLLIYILLILFVAGLVLYTARYVALGSRWASFPGNLSAYDCLKLTGFIGIVQ